MAALPNNNTAVLYVDYTTLQTPHTLQCRFAAPSTADDAMESVDAFLTALSPQLNDITITGARVRDKDTNITFPVTWSGDVGYGDGTGVAYVAAWYVDFLGRSVDGRRVRVAVFGCKSPFAGENYRWAAGENTTIDAAVAALVAAEGTFLSISELTPVWYPYANSGVNAYWRNQIR